MKLKTQIIAGAAGLAFLTFAASSLQAQMLTNVITITATAVMDSATNINFQAMNATITTSNLSVTTKQMLAWLAQDEHAEGKYATNSFPAGAKLVVVINQSTETADIQVLDKNNKFLVDVSDVFNVASGTKMVLKGKVNANRLPDPSVTELLTWQATFNDLGIIGGAGLHFTMSGLQTRTITDTAPKSGFYNETLSVKITNCTGEGTYKGAGLIITTGSVSFSGKVTLPAT